MQRFFEGFEKRADDMDMSGPAPSKEVVKKLLKNNPNPTDDDVHDFSEDKGYNNHKTEQKIYELATAQVKGDKMEKSAFYRGFEKRAKEEIPGGKADGKPDEKYDKDQIRMGIDVEKEHVKSKEKRKEIAQDHLEEFPDYYSRLKKMEAEGKKDKAGH